ncbi:hypothetical protein BBAL3_2576 [Brevundimonas sp. BAL3]|nr:hypothetical protein BBAL3_2576 [Brevundimonas sp. BAL3]
MKGRGMIASRSRLLAASLTVLALALAQGAAAQDMGPASAPANPSDTHPPAVILEPDQVQEAAPFEDEPEDGAPQTPEGDVPPHIVIADDPAEPAIPEVWAPVPLNAQGRSAYGLYLAGKLALMTGEGAKGADWLAQAAALTPEQPRVREQAFTSALLSGDLDVAGRLAPTADAAPAFTEIGRLISAVQTFVHGDARAANAALVARPIAAPHSRAGLMVAPWIAAAAGDWTRALAAPPAQGDVLTLAFARQNRALLLEKRRNTPRRRPSLRPCPTCRPSAPCSTAPMASSWSDAASGTRPWPSIRRRCKASRSIWPPPAPWRGFRPAAARRRRPTSARARPRP